MSSTVPDAGAYMREQAAASKLPGYLAGVYHRGEQVVVAHGVANTVTNTPMRDDTGFLFGSINKVLTATLVHQQVERGVIDLDERVVTYLPELRLKPPAPAADIRVRDLLAHTNGIDADLFFPDVRGRDALKIFVERLENSCGALFAPGEYVSYSNGGMNVAGRMLEVVTGVPYHDLLARDVFAPVGMSTCTAADVAILRSVAVGHFPAASGFRRTDMFMLPDTWAPAGATAIGSIADLIAFGRTQLAHGVSPAGTRILSAESIARMQTVAHDMRTPNVSPLGLGWPLIRFGSTLALSHSGASPGGVAVLVVVPEHEFVFAAFGNDPRAMPLHDQNLLWLFREVLAVKVQNLLATATATRELGVYAGTYRSNQLRVDVRVVDDQLEEQTTYEPEDDAQARIFAGFAGGLYPIPARRLVRIHDDLFAPAGMPLQAFNGYSRQLLISYHGDVDGRPMYRCAGGRMTRRDAQSR